MRSAGVYEYIYIIQNRTKQNYQRVNQTQRVRLDAQRRMSHHCAVVLDWERTPVSRFSDTSKKGDWFDGSRPVVSRSMFYSKNNLFGPTNISFKFQRLFFLRIKGRSSVMDWASKTRGIMTTVFGIFWYVEKGGLIWQIISGWWNGSYLKRVLVREQVFMAFAHSHLYTDSIGLSFATRR